MMMCAQSACYSLLWALFIHLANGLVNVCRCCVVILYIELVLSISIIFPSKLDARVMGPVMKDYCTYDDMSL